MQKLKKLNKKEPCKRLQSLADSGDKTSSPGRFGRPHFQNSFPYFFSFCFLHLTQKCLETRVNRVTKCVTTKIYPMKVRILQFLSFKVTLRTI